MSHLGTYLFGVFGIVGTHSAPPRHLQRVNRCRRAANVTENMGLHSPAHALPIDGSLRPWFVRVAGFPGAA